MFFISATAIMPFLMLSAEPADSPDPPWTGQMQCGVTWTDPADPERSWMFSVASDTNNMKLAISDRARAGDPKPLVRDERRELEARKAKLAITGIGDGEVEVDELSDRRRPYVARCRVSAMSKISTNSPPT